MWLAHSWHRYESISSVYVVFDDECCRLKPKCSIGDLSLHLGLCGCPEHIKLHEFELHQILPYFCGLRNLFVEDYLLKLNCFVSETLLAVFLDHCKNLQSFELHQVNLSAVSESFFYRLINFRNLNQFAMLHCCAKASPLSLHFNDRLIYGLGLLGSLQEIHLTYCKSVTDMGLKALARYCPRLWYGDFSGCPGVSALGVYFFAKYMATRETDMLYLRVLGTEVRGSDLEHFLETSEAEVWKFSRYQMDIIGSACSVQNRLIPSKTVIVFV